MKKLLAIVMWFWVLCSVISCSRTPDFQDEESSKISRAKEIVTTSETIPESAEVYKAKAILLEILITNPTNVEANRMLAQIYYKQSVIILTELTDESSLTQLEDAQNKRVFLLSKALFHLKVIADTSALRKTVEQELFISEE